MFTTSLLLGLSLILQGTAATSAQAVLEQPAKTLQTVKKIENTVRKDPTTAQLTQIGNTQGPIPNGLLTLNYPGLLIKLVVSTYEGNTGLDSLEVTDVSWLDKIGVSLPLTRSEIVKSLGPGRPSAGGLRYQERGVIGAITLQLTFDGEKLIKAVWSYPHD